MVRNTVSLDTFEPPLYQDEVPWHIYRFKNSVRRLLFDRGYRTIRVGVFDIVCNDDCNVLKKHERTEEYAR